MSRAESRITSTPRSLGITLVVAAAMFITGIPTVSALPALPNYTVTASGGTTSTSETGTTDTFSVVLNEAPIGDVVFDVTSGDTSEGTVSTATLTFTTLNWDTAQTVTVTGVDDAIVDGTIGYDVTVAVNAAASEDNWDALADQTVAVTNSDDESPSYTVTASGGTTSTSETGTTDTFTVVLDKQPVANVVFTVTSGDTTEGTVDKTMLTFTKSDWNHAQTVTVTGVDDAIADGTISYQITVAIDTANSNDLWDALPDQTLTATNTNDDAATPVDPRIEVFTDLDGLSAEAIDSIERLAALGITTGVADGEFAPQASVVRSDMALFLVRELEAAGFTLPTASPAAFTDTSGLTVEAQTAVAILAELGITTGMSDGVFNPAGEVNRWQMAIFLTRVLGKLGVALPSTPIATFSDIEGFSAEAQLSIRQLADLGVTTGTATGVFSPDQALPRWQMAIFLIRVIDEVT